MLLTPQELFPRKQLWNPCEINNMSVLTLVLEIDDYKNMLV
jgi:hypothetical protein